MLKSTGSNSKFHYFEFFYEFENVLFQQKIDEHKNSKILNL